MDIFGKPAPLRWVVPVIHAGPSHPLQLAPHSQPWGRGWGIFQAWGLMLRAAIRWIPGAIWRLKTETNDLAHPNLPTSVESFTLIPGSISILYEMPFVGDNVLSSRRHYE